MRVAYIVPVIVVVILVMAWVVMLGNWKLASVQADDGGQLDMKQARTEAAQRPRRIIYNNDGDDSGAGGTPEKFLAARMEPLLHSQVESVFYCTGVTTAFAHLTRVAETFEGYDLIEAGYDPLDLTIDFCHQNDMEILFSLRMNDIHDAFIDWLLANWKREHPEYMFGERQDWDRSDLANPKVWWSALDYEIPEVRDYIYRILKDVCERYDVDGIELDWFRSPMFFRPTLDLQPVEPKHIQIMNDFVRRVRRMTERISRRRGRPLLLAARVPMSVERSYAIGLDVETWLKEDLVDLLPIGGGYVPMAMGQSVREMADFAHQYGVPVYACVSASGMREEHSSVEAWRGAAMNVWHAGADGVYTFNFTPAQRDERFSQMGSPETLKGLDKIYAIDYMVVETFEGDLRPAMVVPDRLPLPLSVDGTVTARLPVGEDIAANAPEGKTTHATLRLRISSLAQGDEVTVKLNGQQLGSAVPAEALVNEPTTAWVELELNPEIVQEGDNLVEVELTAQRAIEEPVVLDRLDLVVRYQ